MYLVSRTELIYNNFQPLQTVALQLDLKNYISISETRRGDYGRKKYHTCC